MGFGKLTGGQDAGFTYYELATVQFRVAGPVAWKGQIESGNWADLASLPWITPNGSSAYSAMLAGLFGDKGLELNTVVRFDNAALGRAMLQAGVGMMLMREEHAEQGERDGYLAVSAIARERSSRFP